MAVRPNAGNPSGRPARKGGRRRRAAGSGRGPAVDRQLYLLHELEVHQVELELQNAELQRTRAEMDTALKRLTELYDYAPVGYLSVDRAGTIQEVNLPGAALLGLSRLRLLGRRFADFVAPASLPVVAAMLRQAFAQPGRYAEEAVLLTADGSPVWTDLQAASTTIAKHAPDWCRLTVSDISAVRRGEEARRRVESLSAANRKATRELARRRRTEARLKTSEAGHRRLLEEAKAMEAQLRYLTHRVLLAQEEERRQISRQLHDEISQVLAGISVQLSALDTETAPESRELRRRIRQVRRRAEQSIRVVHRFARELRPSLLDDLGLVPALRAHLKEMAKTTRLRIQFAADADAEQLGNAERTVLFRVAQEALTNVARHARAHRVTVRIRNRAGMVRLEVADDGRSFSVERMLAARTAGRLGLVGMRERVEMVRGRFSIRSRPGEGTTVIAEIPLPASASKRPGATCPAGTEIRNPAQPPAGGCGGQRLATDPDVSITPVVIA